MNVISIDAPCNGSGKTSLILSILSAFSNTFAFTKFTTIYGDEQFCPAKDHDCACHRLRGDYNICTDAEVLSKPDTDTGKIWCAGAVQTLWCVSKPEGYPEMLREYTTNHLRADTPLLVEGSTVVKHLRPTLHVAVVNPFLPRSWWKDKAGLLRLYCRALYRRRRLPEILLFVRTASSLAESRFPRIAVRQSPLPLARRRWQR